MSKFAQGTQVDVEKSQMQISKFLRSCGCSGVMTGFDGENEFIGFIHNRVQARVICPIAKKDSERRRRWRVLRILIQSKFEMVQCGIRTFEEEFFADIVMPNGQTVAQTALPAVTKAIESGHMPKSLLALPEV